MIETIECCRKTYFVITDNTVIKKTLLKLRRLKFLFISFFSFAWLSIMTHTYEYKFHLHITRYNNDKLKRNVIKLINHVNMNIVYEMKY